MDIEATATTLASAQRLFEVVADLSTYRHWLGLIGHVEPVENRTDDLPTWTVELQARVGPLRRSKKLRMVRTMCESPPELGGTSTIVFSRNEVDARQHSPWELTARVISISVSESSLEMRLHYGGSLFVPMLDRILRAEIDASRKRLVRYLDETNA